jgi:DNA-binding transcriptional MerR regulator
MIPNKSNFKFQELTPITGVKPYVIRFWETEFPEISPIEGESGQKIYSRKDVEMLLKIKKLLFEDKLNIHEVKLKMNTEDIELSSDVPVINNREGIEKALDIIRDIKFRRNW